jgi:hypothetical protein
MERSDFHYSSFQVGVEFAYPNLEKPEMTNYKHHLILKLGQINYK